jgi:hypothetical protein
VKDTGRELSAHLYSFRNLGRNVGSIAKATFSYSDVSTSDLSRDSSSLSSFQTNMSQNLLCVLDPIHCVLSLPNWTAYSCIHLSHFPSYIQHEPPSSAQALGSWIRIPPEAMMFGALILCLCFPCFWLADPPSKESYQLCIGSSKSKSGQGI